MAIDSSVFIHPSDKVALDALKAIPGFTPLLKAFMKVWSEKQFYIQNMSTNLRISDKQLSKYYDMLPPICEKLGIEVPELYLKLDVVPNAYTSGDTKPFIVMTSGLLETMPEELIPTVLAHECGHIACHHVLYHTMGRLILSEAINYLGLNDNIAILPIQVAFFYWMRCSELSADRAAAVCDGTTDKVVKMCMCFAGYDKDVDCPADVEEFMNQALEYRQTVNDSAWNKTMEFILFNSVTHPMNAVRAYECDLWGKSEEFPKIKNYLQNHSERLLQPFTGDIPMAKSSRELIGKDHREVCDYLHSLGFSYIELKREYTVGLLQREGQVIAISVNGDHRFEEGDWYPSDARILVTYCLSETDAEAAAAHPGQLRIPEESWRCLGRNYQEIYAKFREAGFTRIVTEQRQLEKKSWLTAENDVAEICINGQNKFEKGDWVAADSIVRISYYI